MQISLTPFTLQGSSEYNITVLVGQKDSERALRAVHSRFYLSATPLGIGLVGPGLIGGALLEQIREQVCFWFSFYRGPTPHWTPYTTQAHMHSHAHTLAHTFV